MAKNKSQTTYFSLSEEAFILSSLKEVTKVWARGTGLATFNLNILMGLQIQVTHITFPLRTTTNPGSATRRVLPVLQKTVLALNSIVQAYSLKKQLFLVVLKNRLNQSGKMSLYLLLESFSHF